LQEKFSWSGGLRFDTRNLHSKALIENGLTRFSAFDKVFQNWSGSLGCNYAISKAVSYKLNIARGFRAPSIAELGSNGVHEGTGRYEYGNSQLRSEVSWQMDGGVELKYDHLTLSFAAFQNNINHFVFYRKLLNVSGLDSLVLSDGNYYPAFMFNQRSATLSGLELTIDIHPHPIDWLHIENSFSLVRGKFNQLVEVSRNMPLVPSPRWLLELRLEGKSEGKKLKGEYAKLELDNNFRQVNYFSDYSTESATKGYILLNLSGGATVLNKKGNKLFSFVVGLNNLGNVAWQNHLSRLKYTPVNLVTRQMGVFGAGRNFSIKFDCPIEFKK
jgi:iron complex outermembrane receptor protein